MKTQLLILLTLTITFVSCKSEKTKKIEALTKEIESDSLKFSSLASSDFTLKNGIYFPNEIADYEFQSANNKRTGVSFSYAPKSTLNAFGYIDNKGFVTLEIHSHAVLANTQRFLNEYFDYPDNSRNPQAWNNCKSSLGQVEIITKQDDTHSYDEIIETQIIGVFRTGISINRYSAADTDLEEFLETVPKLKEIYISYSYGGQNSNAIKLSASESIILRKLSSAFVIQKRINQNKKEILSIQMK